MIVYSFHDCFGEQEEPVSARARVKPGRLPREVGTRRNHTLVPYASTLRVRKLNMRQAFPKIQAAVRDQHFSTNHLQCRRVMEEIGVNHLLARVPMVRRTKRATGPGCACTSRPACSKSTRICAAL